MSTLRTWPTRIAAAVLLGGALGTGGCDAVEPGTPPRLVVEAFLDAGQPLPPIYLRQTHGLGESADSLVAPVADAQLVLHLGEQPIPYRADAAGRYVPTDARTVLPGASFRLEARWRDQTARAEGSIPPPIRLGDVEVDVPDAPVQAILLDSLRLDTLGVVSREGFIYPVEVTVHWAPLAGPADSLYWVRAQLRPVAGFSAPLVDFFLRPEQILREDTHTRTSDGRRRWTGVYAIPVASEDAPLPEHRVRIALLRSRADYARFATSRDAPDRREPVTNVSGGLGIVAGLSIDSTQVVVE